MTTVRELLIDVCMYVRVVLGNHIHFGFRHLKIVVMKILHPVLQSHIAVIQIFAAELKGV